MPHTAWHTAMKSAPASTSGRALSGVIPPIATQGISNKVDHQVRIDGWRPVMRRLGRGRIEGAERDIVRAGLARLHREMAAVVAGLADLRRRAEQRARLADVAVALAQVDAVGAEPLGQLHAVIDDERDIGIGADALQRLGEPRQLMLVDVLHAQLERRRDAGLERGLEPVRKGARRRPAG